MGKVRQQLCRMSLEYSVEIFHSLASALEESGRDLVLSKNVVNDSGEYLVTGLVHVQ